MKPKVYIYLFFIFFPFHAFSWDQHDLITKLALQEIKWLDKFNKINVTSFKEFLSQAFSKEFTEKDFLKQYQLNADYSIGFKNPNEKNSNSYPSIGETTSARTILENYADEPDWGMDENLNLSPDQEFMGGTKGPTSKGFRHLYVKKWSIMAPLRTLHYPPRTLGEAPQRAQICYNLSEIAFEAHQLYWAFRFLAWSLHYIQDLGQPFHSSQLLTPKFFAWNDIFNFKKLTKRMTLIISNYHWMYEKYVSYRIENEIQHKVEPLLLSALKGKDFIHSSSALLIAKHASDFSNHFSFETGESCLSFFGKKFLEPTVDVPNSPPEAFPVKKYDESPSMSKHQRTLFLETTAKNLKKTAFYTRSLLELAREEFLNSNPILLNASK